MYRYTRSYVCMVGRTTIEIDDELLDRAKRALGQSTIRATVEEALRRVADAAEGERDERAALQRRYFDGLAARVDIAVLKSEEMWR